MTEIRRSQERGHAQHGWLDSFHSFSVAEYQVPAHLGFGALRVINEDRVQPGKGFGTHGHRDMEIISYVLEGGLAHQDSMGNGSVIRRGDVQRMSAGTGVRHSEYNASEQEPVHFLQIWIEPARRGLAPGYEQKHFAPSELENTMALVASSDGRNGSVTIQQDCAIYASQLTIGHALDYTPSAGRRAYLQLARGSVLANGERLLAGDGLRLADEVSVHFADADSAEFLLFDLR